MPQLFLQPVMVCPQTGERTAMLRCQPESAYLADHFPGFPVMPGVMLLEAFRQAFLADVESSASPEKRLDVIGFEAFRFRKFVRPGDEVRIVVRPQWQRGIANCCGFVGEECVARGRLEFKSAFEACTTAYHDGCCSEFTGWRWFTNYLEIVPGRSAVATISPPDFARQNHNWIPEPFILEGLAQSGVHLISKARPHDHITALVKIAEAQLLKRVPYSSALRFEVDVQHSQPQGAGFHGVARLNGQPVLEADFMLAFAKMETWPEENSPSYSMS